MIIWKQGQFCPELGEKVIEFPNKIKSGPSDAMIKIDGFDVQPDENGNYVQGRDGVSYTEDDLDAINTFAVIRMVINLYEDLLGTPIQWSWWKDGKGDPLLVKIRNNDINARFIKEYKCIELDYYGPYGNWTYNCRSVDLIAHETGHVILDSMLPHLNEGNAEIRGIGEAFCDLTAMFWILSQKDLCKNVIEETGGDLKKPSILSLFGAGYGSNANQFKELRSALIDPISPVQCTVSYDYSKVLIGAVYEMLINIYFNQENPSQNDYERLFISGHYWMKNLVNSIYSFPLKDLSIKSLVEKLIYTFEIRREDMKKHLKGIASI